MSPAVDLVEPRAERTLRPGAVQTTPTSEKAMDFITGEHLLRMSVEITLGVCLKLFCDNGRIHWRDFVNDFLFWLPGLSQEPGDGLTRQVEAMVPHHEDATDDHLPLAAK